MAAATQLKTGKLTARKLSAVKRRARNLGLTPEEYLRQLIEEDLAVSAKAGVTSLEDVAAPFREAFAGVAGEELDQRVKAARVALG